MAERKDYYKILGINKNASENEIKSAFKKLAVTWHPDKFATESEEKKKEAEEKFKDINEAYSVLSDKEKRAQYDNPQPEGFDGWCGFNPFDPFGRSSQQQRVNIGTDIRLTLNVSIEEAYKGTLKKLKFKKKEHCSECNGTGSKDGIESACPHCNGTGMFREESRNGNSFFIKQSPCPFCGGSGKTIKNPCEKCNGTGLEQKEVIEEFEVPSGVFTGAGMTINGKGNMPKGEGIPGTIQLVFNVLNDDYYQIDPNNIININHIEEVPFNEALLGCEREVTLIDGTKKKIKIEEGCQDGKKYLFRGKGMPNIMQPYNGNGDFIVMIKFKYPTKLSKDQKELLKNWKW